MFNKVEFDVALIRKGVKYSELAEDLHIDLSTLYRKIKNNGDFDRAQIAIIMRRLDIEDPKPIFFAPDLAQETRKAE